MQILLWISCFTFFAFNCYSQSEIQSPVIPRLLEPNWSTFLKENGVSEYFKPSMDLAVGRYEKALAALSGKSESCRVSTADVNWMERAKLQFSAEEIRKHSKDFRTAILFRSIELEARCRENAEKDALHAEAQMLPFLYRMHELVQQFSEKLNKSQKDVLKPLAETLNTIVGARPTPLQLVAFSYTTPQGLAKRDALHPKVLRFVATDPSFQNAYNSKRAVEPLSSF